MHHALPLEIWKQMMIESYSDLTKTISNAMCKRRNTGACAAICLSHLSHGSRNRVCPEVERVFKEDAKAIADALLNKMVSWTPEKGFSGGEI